MRKSTDNTEAIKKLLREIYGEIPPRPVHLDYENKYFNENYAAGKAVFIEKNIILDLGEKNAEITVKTVMPKGNLPCFTIIYLSDEEHIPNRFLPVEEIIDRGYGIISIFADDIAESNNNFKLKLASKIARSRRKKDAASKTAIWAWALMRAVDLAYEGAEIDRSKIILASHGIYSRATMLAAALDERVSYVIANGLSCYPPLYSEENPKTAECVRDYPYLYCPAFVSEPFGDEYSALLEGCSHTNILIGEAEDGYGCDPMNDAKHISTILAKNGCDKLEMTKEIPTAPIQIDRGNISYHLRAGTDYFSREDWNIYLDFIDKSL